MKKQIEHWPRHVYVRKDPKKGEKIELFRDDISFLYDPGHPNIDSPENFDDFGQ